MAAVSPSSVIFLTYYRFLLTFWEKQEGLDSPLSQLSALPPRGRTPAHSPLIKQKVTKSTIGPSLRNIVERNIPETERENRTVQFRIITSFFEIKIAKSFYSLITWHGFKMRHHHK